MKPGLQKDVYAKKHRQPVKLADTQMQGVGRGDSKSPTGSVVPVRQDLGPTESVMQAEIGGLNFGDANSKAMKIAELDL
jgi:hypothetical protein